MAGVPTPGLDLIKTFEGLSLVAYPDPKTGNLPITIGWGSTRDKYGQPFKLGDRITREEADELLMRQVANDYLPPQGNIPGWASMNDNQRGAVLSFAYNLGARFFGASGFETISRVLRNQDWKDIEAALILYRNPGSSVEEGLLRRRLSEANVFLAGVPGVALSAAGQKYLAGGRTPVPGSRLSREAQEYLANRPTVGGGSAGGGSAGGGSGSGSGGSSGGGSGGLPSVAPGSRLLALTSPYTSGTDVQKLQGDLARWGYATAADGVFGPGTKQAVEQFQRSQGLLVNGTVGPETWIALQKSPTPPTPPMPPTPPAPPTSPTPPAQNRLLRLTNPYTTGADVFALQQLLTRAGFPVAADNVFGPGSDRAVRQFQASRGLVADGVVGAQTWAALQNPTATTPRPPAPGTPTHIRVLRLANPYMQGEDVRRVQQALARAGFPVAVDGVFGPGSDRAVRQFQASRGLSVDGVVGSLTRARLGV
jgi:peptidoglycan hydrolase-like protein with peptidoglycan-binding domain/GH24 family phage-related lysozyme (muramidase)